MITFDILVSIRGVTIMGVTIRGVTESGDDQYDFHYLYTLSHDADCAWCDGVYRSTSYDPN